MLNLLKSPRYLLAIAVIVALALMLVPTSIASAASTKPQDNGTLASSCLSVQPTYQEVGVGLPAKLQISATACPLPPQPVPEASVIVTWGDGSTSTYTYCMEVCWNTIDASHVYKTSGDYYPSICLDVPTSVTAGPCTSVEIKVSPVITPLT